MSIKIPPPLNWNASGQCIFVSFGMIFLVFWFLANIGGYTNEEYVIRGVHSLHEMFVFGCIEKKKRGSQIHFQIVLSES